MSFFTGNGSPAYIAIRSAFGAFLSVCLLSAMNCIAQPQAGNKYRFTISNETKFAVDEVRLSPGGKNNWGEDYTANSVLKPGQAITIADLAPGQYDVKFVDDGGRDCILQSIPIFSEMSWSLTSAFIGNCAGFGQGRKGAAETDNRLTIKNNSRLEVLEIQTSPGGTNQWGPDRTGDTTVRPGGTIVLKNLAAGQYDIKIIVEDGDSCVLKGINPVEQPAWNLTMQWLRGCGETGPAHKRAAAPPETGFRVTLNNKSGYTLNEIQVSPAGANKWGPDRTGDQNLKAGESIILKNIETGTYDIKIADQSGSECVVRDMKIAGNQAWDLTTQSLRNCGRFGLGTK